MSRNQVATSAYAYNSDTLDGLDSSDLIQNQTATTQTANFKITGSGTLATLNAGTSIALGTASTTTGTMVMKNGTNANTVTLQSGVTGTSYTMTLPTAVGASGDCMKTSDASGTLTFGACAAGGGVTTVGALDGGTANANGATISSTTIYLQSASATYAGLVNTTTQTFTGDKIFKSSSNSPTAFQIQDSSSVSLFTADTSAGIVRLGTATNGVEFTTAGTTYKGTARPTKTVTFAPEYTGATFTGDGTNNTGSLSSDFCSSSSLLNINATACGSAADEHNYYAWANTQATAQDYDIYVRYRMPADYDTDSMTDMKIFGWGTTSANEVVSLSLYKANVTACSTITNAITGNTAWNEGTQASPLGACSIVAGDMVTFKVHVVAGQNNTARAGEISFTYRSKL